MARQIRTFLGFTIYITLWIVTLWMHWPCKVKHQKCNLKASKFEKYGSEVIATYNCDKQCVLYIIEPKKCDLNIIRTEKDKKTQEQENKR